MGLRDSLVKGKPSDPEDFSVAPLTDIKDIPLTNYRFVIMIGSDQVALFQKVSSIAVERKTEEIVEGGYHDHTFEFPKHFSYSHIKFEVGLASSSFFYEWIMQGVDHGYAVGKDFDLIQQNLDESVAKTWNFFGAFPTKWQISDLSITNSKAIVVEKLELSFNYFQLAP
jgi:phage tail-like protein